MRCQTPLLCAVLVLLFLSACTQQPPPQPDTRAADEAAVRAASAEWSQATMAKDLEKCLSYYAAEASVFPPNAPVAAGNDARRQFWASMLNTPGLAVNWTTTRVEVARSGDLAYEAGTYEMTAADKKGQSQTQKGKYVAVWKKQADGAWKAIADIFNADQ